MNEPIEQAVPLSRLAVFPFSHGDLYRVSLAASFASGVHLLWFPILLVVSLIAIVIDRAPAMLWCAVVAAFAVCLVVWCHTVLQVVQRVLRQRKIRELAVLVVLVLVVTVSMLPVLFKSQAMEPEAGWLRLPELANSVAGRITSVFPPSIAATALAADLCDSPPAVDTR